MGLTLFGSVAIFIAVFLVKKMPTNVLTWMVMLVVLYTSISMLRSAAKNTSGNLKQIEDIKQIDV